MLVVVMARYCCFWWYGTVRNWFCDSTVRYYCSFGVVRYGTVRYGWYGTGLRIGNIQHCSFWCRILWWYGTANFGAGFCIGTVLVGDGTVWDLFLRRYGTIRVL